MGWDYLTGHKPSLIGSVNGMITGLVAITPAAGFVNGWGAIVIGVIAATIVYFALNYLSRMRPFRNVDDTLGVVYTHGFAGLSGGSADGRLRQHRDGLRARSDLGLRPPARMAGSDGTVGDRLLGDRHLRAAEAGRIGGAVADGREGHGEGDLAVHGHEVYPSDVPSLAFPGGSEGYAPTPPAGTDPPREAPDPASTSVPVATAPASRGAVVRLGPLTP